MSARRRWPWWHQALYEAALMFASFSMLMVLLNDTGVALRWWLAGLVIGWTWRYWRWAKGRAWQRWADAHVREEFRR